jgi:hypothetical protein
LTATIRGHLQPAARLTLAALLLASAAPRAALSQDAAPAEAPSASAEAPQASEPGPVLPEGAYGETPTGVPYSSLFRNTSTPYLHPSGGASFQGEPKVGSTEGSIGLRTERFGANIPLLHQGFEPQNADLKLGPIFIKLHSISAGILASDNIWQSETDRKSGVVGIVSMGAAITIQLTESFHFSLAGNYTYLPFKNAGGLSGFGLVAPFLASVDGTPLLLGQVSQDAVIAGWPVVFADEYRISYGTNSSNIRDSLLLFDGFDFEGADRAGRYVFSSHGRKQTGRDLTESDNTRTFLYLSNVISAQTERLFPGSIRLRAGLFHENLWYNNSIRGLPSMRDQGNIYVGDEREDTRFKPYADYRVLHLDTRNGVSQTLNIGLHGPITDQLTMRTEIGGYRSASGRTGLLWLARLQHVAGPYTNEALYVRRGLSDFADEIHTGIGYLLNQTLGPGLKADLFADYGTIEDIDTGNGYRLLQTGLRFEYFFSPRTEFNLAGIYQNREHDNLYGSDQEWLGRFEMYHKITDTLMARLYYQFTRRDTARQNGSYYENLIFLYLTKNLD